MKKNNIRDTPVIVIPKGYTIDDLMDFDDEGYENGEPVAVEEVKVFLENEERNSAYEKLTPQRKQLVDKVMENLEKGNLFWSQGWVSSGAPESAVTGKKYRGINNLFLSLIAMSENYEDNRWATFKQMEEKGWTFKKDEEGNSLAKGKGATVEYYEMRDKETKKRFDRSVLDGMTASEQQE